MSGRITTVSKPPKLERKKRVAAYARVSSGKDAMLHSLSAQVSHYSDLIQRNSDWLYAGVYADEAKTGTKDSRADFQRLIADCHAGKIDMVITKSISRFARNTVTLLQTVRDFKAWEVDIFFEEQNIHTMSADGELMLTILASYAQEESRSASENQKWRIKRNFEEGMPWNGAMLGYRLKDGRYEIVPKEAALVRRIYNEYLAGDGYQAVAKRLTEEGVPSRFGGKWNQSVVSKILSNYPSTIKFAPNNASWRIQLKGDAETGDESLSQYGKTDFAYHILVFHRVTSDHYILETMAESELDALKANSEFWATNGINKSSKAFGKIRIG